MNARKESDRGLTGHRSRPAVLPVFVFIGVIQGSMILIVSASLVFPIVPPFAVPPLANRNDDASGKDRSRQQPNRQRHPHALHGVSLLPRFLGISPPDASPVPLRRIGRVDFPAVRPSAHWQVESCCPPTPLDLPATAPAALASGSATTANGKAFANLITKNFRIEALLPVNLSSSFEPEALFL